MASKKTEAAVRGAKLVKKALAAAAAVDFLASPEPMAASLAKKMVLPNGEPLSAGMRALLVVDTDWLGVDFDDEEGEMSGMSLEEAVEEAFGEEAVAAFAEAYDLLPEEVVYFDGDVSRPACLYCGVADDEGEYPVIQMSWEDGVAKIGGFVPFDVWVAQELGALPRGAELGDVPAEYAALPGASAKANADGRAVFTPIAGEPVAPEVAPE
ncbi:MAG: hypothetical protein IPF92_07045 [Myxococcales bacterium]|jgi:hypothetical protein|nr:hypothetical protein [Myxococcales bacterium]MBL0192797.1 hypothetical protein [Myxococcales bacterium]HQY62578.1 hypothetical protein [Polyangiaceae bacterium]